MCSTLQRLLTGDVLSVKSRQQLEEWLVGNTTGGALIRAGVPQDWKVGDKTGNCGDGTVNDVAILRPPGRDPIFVAIYTFAPAASGDERRKLVADVARIVAKAFAEKSPAVKKRAQQDSNLRPTD